jgi:hypothetical protein
VLRQIVQSIANESLNLPDHAQDQFSFLANSIIA